MGTVEVRKFLDYLAVSRNVSISTQKTALNALVFFCHMFLRRDLGQIQFDYAKKPKNVPVVFTRGEAAAVLLQLYGRWMRTSLPAACACQEIPRRGYSHGPGPAGTQGFAHETDLYPGYSMQRTGGAKSIGKQIVKTLRRFFAGRLSTVRPMIPGKTTERSIQNGHQLRLPASAGSPIRFEETG